jgi:hypothetical protein
MKNERDESPCPSVEDLSHWALVTSAAGACYLVDLACPGEPCPGEPSAELWDYGRAYRYIEAIGMTPQGHVQINRAVLTVGGWSGAKSISLAPVEKMFLADLTHENRKWFRDAIARAEAERERVLKQESANASGLVLPDSMLGSNHAMRRAMKGGS